jgi:excisionase family DNA binding protein
MGTLSEEIQKYEKDFENGRVLSEAGGECKDILTEDWESALVSEPENDELLSIEDVAEMLGVSTQTLRNWEKQGKLVPATRTAGNHRRYSRSQINAIRGKQMAAGDIILPAIPVHKLRDLTDRLLGSFEPDERISVSIKVDHVEKKIVLLLDSEDRMSCISKTFKMED